MRKSLLIVPVAAALLSGCASIGTSVKTTPVNQGAAVDNQAANNQNKASGAPAKPKAGVGSAIDLKGLHSGDELEVTVVKIVDPDGSTDEFSSPDSGKRYVSVQFQLVNKGSGTYSDDPQIDVAVKDAAGQSFDPEIMVSSTKAGEQMSSSIDLGPGEKALGFLTFQVPNGDKLATVQYKLNAGMAGDIGEWTVN